ncbi:hypothetical protein [Thalassobellus sediminis]|uniref:hypothetical protein n=1 Tax=Thalassobellus sediminis TaxID=3367753 RepID=UPI00379D3E34
MKKILVIITLFVFSYSQSQNIKNINIKAKYENIFYKSPNDTNKETPFKVNKVVFSSNFKGSKNENKYQVSVYGIVNNKKETIHYNAASIEEVQYYSKIFHSKFKKIVLYEYEYKVGANKYTDTSIVVEY